LRVAVREAGATVTCTGARPTRTPSRNTIASAGREVTRSVIADDGGEGGCRSHIRGADASEGTGDVEDAGGAGAVGGRGSTCATAACTAAARLLRVLARRIAPPTQPASTAATSASARRARRRWGQGWRGGTITAELRRASRGGGAGSSTVGVSARRGAGADAGTGAGSPTGASPTSTRISGSLRRWRTNG